MKNFVRTFHAGHLMFIGATLLLFLITFIPHVPSFFIYIPLSMAFAIIGYKALKKLMNGKIGTEAFLVIATGIAIFGGQPRAITIVLLIMLFADYLEDVITERTQQEIQSLINLIPNTATVIMNGTELDIPVDEIKHDMKVLIKTGRRIPVDGFIIKGTAEINESSLTGESIPKEKTIGATVFAGTYIESGYIVVQTEKLGSKTYFGTIITLVQETEAKKAHVAILADTIAFYLIPSLLFFIGITWLITKNINLIVTLLVFGSPLELTLVTPLTVLAGIIAAFRNGVMVKGGLVLEKFAKADTIFFDKTGTLTLGSPKVIDVVSYSPSASTQDILKIAAIAQKRSEHVIAQAILKKADDEHIEVPDPTMFKSISGHGVEIEYNNNHYFLGNKHFIQAPEHGNTPIPESILQQEDSIYSSFYLTENGKILGKIYVFDEIRKEAQDTIKSLKKVVKNIILVSGDKQNVATHIAVQLGIQKAYGDIFPDQKLSLIQNYQREGHIVAMVGDGINDAPALKQADVGIAMGAMGIEPAIEAADIVLPTNDLNKIYFIRKLSERTFTVIKQNLIIGFLLIHTLGITLAFLEIINPIQAALFHAIPDISILINSALLINFRVKKED